jgi:phosphate-selective porin OprO/OprP
MLTGESRKYDLSKGNFGGIKPNHRFSGREHTWGAWEWASRLSYTDLSSGSIQGGNMGIVSTGFNCYLTARYRLMLNGGAAHIRNPSDDNTLYFLQCRLQLEL